MSYYRLPELFAGSARTTYSAPVPYPVACRPQAWAAGSFPLILQAILGLRPNAPNGELLIVRPRLPHWLETVQLRGLRVGKGEVDQPIAAAAADDGGVLHSRRVQVRSVDLWPL
jgi:glycogen debranching enzyme